MRLCFGCAFDERVACRAPCGGQCRVQAPPSNCTPQVLVCSSRPPTPTNCAIVSPIDRAHTQTVPGVVCACVCCVCCAVPVCALQLRERCHRARVCVCVCVLDPRIVMASGDAAMNCIGSNSAATSKQHQQNGRRHQPPAASAASARRPDKEVAAAAGVAVVCSNNDGGSLMK